MGGFLVADTILGAIPEDMRAIAGALTATIAAIVAATIAWMAFHGTMTLGVAVPIILAAVGVGIAGVKAAVGMAEGGLVTKPTVALIGESGPELVIPLARFSEIVEESVNATVGKTRRGSSFTEDIPHFAEGGVVEAPTVGLVGEAGPEAVTPLNRLSEVVGSELHVRCKLKGLSTEDVAKLKETFVKNDHPKFRKQFAAMRHTAYGTTKLYEEGVQSADLTKKATLVKTIAILLQTKVYLFWRKL